MIHFQCRTVKTMILFCCHDAFALLETFGRGFKCFRCMQILARVAERLEYLHAHGYVHRDLKPSNVVWLQHSARWTLTSLPTAARTGEPAAAAFTLCYTAPEVVEELQSGAGTVTPQPAQDVWAVGVMAVELLTGSPAFDIMKHNLSQVCLALQAYLHI